MTDPRNYALAAFATAVEPWLEALRAVQAQFEREPELLAQLADRGSAFDARRRRLQELLPAGAGDPCRNFLFTLLERGDLEKLPAIADWMGAMAGGGPQARMALVTTAYALSAEERQRFVATLRQRRGADLEVSFAVDAAIVGGAVVRVGDQVMDGSVRAKLQALDGALVRGD